MKLVPVHLLVSRGQVLSSKNIIHTCGGSVVAGVAYCFIVSHHEAQIYLVAAYFDVPATTFDVFVLNEKTSHHGSSTVK